MKIEEAKKIFNEWHQYMEIASKLDKVFMTGIPESFLPYPKNTIRESLNIVKKFYYDVGDIKNADSTTSTEILFLDSHIDDEEAINKIVDSWVLKNLELRKTIIEELKKVRDSWLEKKYAKIK